jgi:uncharacterized protein (DUF4415 family)
MNAPVQGNAVVLAAYAVPRKRANRQAKSVMTKKSVHLRLSPDVLDYFRSTGPGWQTRIDEALRKAARLGARKS